jgi:hypothetical protein
VAGALTSVIRRGFGSVLVYLYGFAYKSQEKSYFKTFVNSFGWFGSFLDLKINSS